LCFSKRFPEFIEVKARVQRPGIFLSPFFLLEDKKGGKKLDSKNTRKEKAKQNRYIKNLSGSFLFLFFSLFFSLSTKQNTIQ
jgi:hypothetical protein